MFVKVMIFITFRFFFAFVLRFAEVLRICAHWIFDTFLFRYNKSRILWASWNAYALFSIEIEVLILETLRDFLA